MNNPSDLYDILGREFPTGDETYWHPPDDIDLTPVKEAVKNWAKNTILYFVKLIGTRIIEIPQRLAHPFGPIGYELENYYTAGVALIAVYKMEGIRGIIKGVAPDAYTVYVHGLKDDEGGAASIRLMLDGVIFILAAKCPKIPDRKGTLTKDELDAFSRIADKYDVQLDIVGSRAAGKGRHIHTDRPVGKSSDQRSDIDVKVDGQAVIDSRGQLADDLKNIGDDPNLVQVLNKFGDSYPPVIIIKPKKDAK